MGIYSTMAAYRGRAALALVLTTGLALIFAGGAAADTAAPAAPPVSELPSCAEGPERVGGVVLGTPCDDRIVAPASAAAVYGGPGDDVLVGANSGVATRSTGDPSFGLHLEVGSQTFEGGSGNDIVYGDRGNDTLRGNAGDDRLYGGIGDDVVEGGEGNDFLAGGFGSDDLDGQSGDDFVRGDATIDHLFDSGGGTDTLSFATGATPGFGAAKASAIAGVIGGFPTGAGAERGVSLELGAGGVNALDGEPSLGGGNDEVEIGAFERIIGTPFADYIIGSGANEDIWGGGGADVINGGGGFDTVHGGADGDYLTVVEGAIDGEGGNDNCVSAAPKANCEGTAATVSPRGTGAVSVGVVTAGTALTQVYVVGSEAADAITASVFPGAVVISLGAGSFNPELGGCAPIDAQNVSCPVSGLLDSIVVAAKGGNDVVTTVGVPDGVSVVELGGDGVDQLTGSGSEDVLVDGPDASADVLAALGGDDALTHNDGPDLLDGGEGSDLFLSVSICDGVTIDGGAERSGAPTPDRDNASWARLEGIGVDARLDLNLVGEIGPGEQPTCASGSFDALPRIEDLEASNQSDVLYGNQFGNQLLGHKGEDTYFALDGDDSILANSGTRDRVINCGPGSLDQAVIDFASVGDPTPVECERVREGAAGEFKELPLLSEPAPPPPPPPPPKDRKPPQTKLLRHPPKLLRVAPRQRKLVAFRFAASEKSRFRCKLDRKPYAACGSPRKYRVRVGRHVFRIFAIDVAGNRDRTPAAFEFRVVAKRPHRAGAAAR